MWRGNNFPLVRELGNVPGLSRNGLFRGPLTFVSGAELLRPPVENGVAVHLTLTKPGLECSKCRHRPRLACQPRSGQSSGSDCHCEGRSACRCRGSEKRASDQLLQAQTDWSE